MIEIQGQHWAWLLCLLHPPLSPQPVLSTLADSGLTSREPRAHFLFLLMRLMRASVSQQVPRAPQDSSLGPWRRAATPHWAHCLTSIPPVPTPPAELSAPSFHCNAHVKAIKVVCDRKYGGYFSAFDLLFLLSDIQHNAHPFLGTLALRDFQKKILLVCLLPHCALSDSFPGSFMSPQPPIQDEVPFSSLFTLSSLLSGLVALDSI